MSFREIKTQRPRIYEINKIVGLYEIHIDGIAQTLKVKILKMELAETDCYMGIANLEVKGSGCADFYRSIHPESTEKAALLDAINGFFAFLSHDAIIREVDDW